MNRKNGSLKGKMIAAFIITSIIPTIIIIIFSYVNTSYIVHDNVDELIHSNLQQTKSSLDVWVDSYQDILFQIYMNDDIVDMVDDLNSNEDNTLVSGQLRSRIRGLFYTKKHIKSITIISKKGEVVFYDLLTGSGTQTSWMDTLGMSQEELYNRFSEDNSTHIITTKEAGTFAAETYYLFHLGHRIIDYQNVNKELGVVIISVDEAMLQSICNEDVNENSFNFMVDQEGVIISYHDKNMLGQNIIEWSEDESERRSQYLDFINKNDSLQSKYVTVNSVFDDRFGCDIVNVSNQNEVISRLNTQQQIMITVMLLALLVLVITIAALIRNMMGSFKNMINIMEITGKGDMSARVSTDRKTPSELKVIALQFNNMMQKLQRAMTKEKEANVKQKNAEIAALEAQINPHFLYNTLDTINWMAIDKDEFEISNSITSLASILRYGIENSNGIVTVGRECEWLKQYLFLQQTRLKGSFECEINVFPEVMNWEIHKLLLQPFVENAILHGFDALKDPSILRISIEPEGEKLVITIWDNGKGISPNLLKEMNQGYFIKSAEKNCIGMENAITRIQMYYGSKASVKIESEEDTYTCVRLYIPKIEG